MPVGAVPQEPWCWKSTETTGINNDSQYQRVWAEVLHEARFSTWLWNRPFVMWGYVRRQGKSNHREQDIRNTSELLSMVLLCPAVKWGMCCVPLISRCLKRILWMITCMAIIRNSTKHIPSISTPTAHPTVHLRLQGEELRLMQSSNCVRIHWRFTTATLQLPGAWRVWRVRALKILKQVGLMSWLKKIHMSGGSYSIHDWIVGAMTSPSNPVLFFREWPPYPTPHLSMARQSARSSSKSRRRSRSSSSRKSRSRRIRSSSSRCGRLWQ